MIKKKAKPKSRKPGAGRPTELTDVVFANIKKGIIEGHSFKKIANDCDIPESTFYTWHSDNYLGLADKVEGWQRDRKLVLAEIVIKEMLEIDHIETKCIYGKEYKAANPAILKIKQDTAKFVAETLGRKTYAKRSEITGEDGEPLPVLVQFVNAADHNTNPNRIQEAV